MANCNPQLAECLADWSTYSCCSCEEATKLRCLALAHLKELTCGCMSSPVSIGEVRYPSPVEAMDALRRLIQMTYEVCERSADLEGPVMETIWKDVCGGSAGCNPCDDGELGQFHRSCETYEGESSSGDSC